MIIWLQTMQICPVPFPAQSFAGAGGRLRLLRRSITMCLTFGASDESERLHHGFRWRRFLSMRRRVPAKRRCVSAVSALVESTTPVTLIALQGAGRSFQSEAESVVASDNE